VIQLSKVAEPNVLATNKAAWTSEFKQGIDKRRYAHNDIRSALGEETSRKCAYCESRVEHVVTTHVEHILPKSGYPDLVCDWQNLTVACPKCNQKKAAYDNPSCRLVNPYSDNPKDHLRWIGPWVTHVTNDRGRVTITKLALNRADLMFQRARECQRVEEILRLMEQSEAPVKDALKEDLLAAIADEAEYSAAIRSLIELELGSLPS
jgi:uncharacterized protein (TIGR02646 family)